MGRDSSATSQALHREGASMSDPIDVAECPRCNAPMEIGFIATEQKGGGVLSGGLRCSRIVWCEEFKMGFVGGPKGEYVSTMNTHKKYMAIPAVRCSNCRMITFGY